MRYFWLWPRTHVFSAKAMASPDPLSGVALLGAGAGGAGPLVFHAVDSHEQKDKSSTSLAGTEDIILPFIVSGLLI
ncbi:hypothetical protein EVAR_85326_1 [Eumeta japonica]|uniref:Uncharacterized protein n=1 Tax=Eumeta variegata TaxID=151549 RepID=A0A4C1ZZL1_EUMVA|nr:hypothetical protein EVAR_85326_1 [Eumeta japonica]